jgi:Gpi18-like mannosyltransferase
MKKYFLILILLFAFFLRIYGLNWDGNSHIHPDERFMTMVADSIKIPSSLSQYFNTNTSPLNPHNQGYGFYVYGTFPLFLTKIIGELTAYNNYSNIHFVGRLLSALFDTMSVYLLYLISKNIFKKSKYVYTASLIYTFLVLPLQLSHFFTVDTFASTLVLASFWAASSSNFLLMAIFFGLALSSKISVLIFFPILALFYIKYKQKNKILNIVLILFLIFIVFRIFQPYAFSGFAQINPRFLDNIVELKYLGHKDSNFPPSVQWLSKTKIIFPLQNIFLWGVGLPMSLSFIIFFCINIFKQKKQNLIINISLLSILIVVIFHGTQLSHPMRYFILAYPFICLSLAYFVANNPKFIKIFYLAFCLNLVWVFMFISIYSRPNTRVEASRWINKNIPQKSVLTNESWDDPLPLNNGKQYESIMLDLYDPESPQKWKSINSKLDKADYMIMSSNRLWGSITKVPDKYPITSKYYRDIFQGETSWNLLARFVSYPGISIPFLNKCIYIGKTDYPINNNSLFEIDRNCFNPGIYIRDDIADESFTVYDHAQVLIFKKD